MPVEKDSSYKPLGSIHGAGQGKKIFQSSFPITKLKNTFCWKISAFQKKNFKGVNRKLQLDTKQFSAYKPLSSITGAGKHLPSQSSSTNPGNGCSQTSQGKNG